MEELVLDQRQVEEEAGVDKDTRCVDVDGSAVILKESLRRCTVDIKFDDLEHFSLHGQKLILRVSLPCHLDQVLHCGWVDLLEFAGDEQGSYAHELKSVYGHAFVTEIAIDNIHCDKERFRQ